MTAYELAEFIETGGENIDRKELANMLRQQADRIAELEKQGELIAWMDGNEICPEIGYEATITTEHPKDLGWKPLYTTPQTKPLSDEEIIAIRDSCYVQSGIDEWEFDDVNFARAIEERHGIK